MNRRIIRVLLACALADIGCGDDAHPPGQYGDASQSGSAAPGDPRIVPWPASDAGSGLNDATVEPGWGLDGAAAAPEAGWGLLDAALPAQSPDAGAELFDGSAALEAGIDANMEAAGDELDGAVPDGSSGSAADDAGGEMDGGAATGDAATADAQSGIDTRLTYYRDAKPILDAKCAPCHYAGGIGPFPLTTYAEVQPYASSIRYAVESGEMPPWLAVGEHGVFVGDRRLTEPQESALLRWIDEGALAGDPNAAPGEPIPPDRRGLERVDLSLPIPGPYTQQIVPDDYRCFVLDWPYDRTKFITGMSIEPERTQNVHHAILYLEPPANAASVRAQDAADLGAGFTCFGNADSLATWLTSYEPGGFGQSVPDGVGFEVAPGSLLVLQIHYNALNGTGPDTSRVDFELADAVEHEGTVGQLADPLWLLGFMPISANQPDVVHRWRGRPSQLAGSATYDIHWVDLHMHVLGSRGSISILRAGGTREPLLEIPEWEFHWQQTYVLRQPVKLNAGDELEVECHFDNTAAHQMVVDGQRLQPRDVNWGEGTTDEMCLGNVLATPAL